MMGRASLVWVALALGAGCNDHRYGALPGLDDADGGPPASDDDDDGDGDDDSGAPPVTTLPPGEDSSVPDPTVVTVTMVPPDMSRCEEQELPAMVPVQGFGDTRGTGDQFQLGCGFLATSDAVFLWAAPRAGRFRFDTVGEGAGTRVAVLGGLCGGDELACAEGEPGAIVDVEMVAGELVTVVVETIGESGLVVLTIDEAPPRVCTSANIGAQLGVISGSTAFAVSQWDALCGGEDAREAVFRWIPPFAGVFRFETLASEFEPAIYLRQGDCEGPDLICGVNSTGLEPSFEVALDPVAGDVMVIVDSRVPGQAGDFVLQISAL